MCRIPIFEDEDNKAIESNPESLSISFLIDRNRDFDEYMLSTTSLITSLNFVILYFKIFSRQRWRASSTL